MGITTCVRSIAYHAIALKKSILAFPPPKALIGPSQNLLSKEVFDQYSFPISDHCVAMSLHFLKNYRENHDIRLAADLMKKGCTLECARTSLVYDQIFEKNVEQASQTMPEKDFLELIRNETAKTLDLQFAKKIKLCCPFDQIIPYMKTQLPAGEFAIPLRSHLIALVKDEQGKMVLFDPNHGAIDLAIDEGVEWFIKVLEKHRIQFSERVSFLQLSSYQSGDSRIIESSKIVFPEEKPELTFEKAEGRWGVAIFKWRGKTVRFCWDSVTGYIYNGDSANLVRKKILILVPKTAVDTIIRTIYHTANAIIKTLALPFSLVQGRQTTVRQCYIIQQSVADIFRAPFYGLLETAVSLYGVLKPYEGRRLIGYLERCLNCQNDRVDLREKYYGAPCFKPQNFGAVQDKKATIRALKKNVLFQDYTRGKSLLTIFWNSLAI